MRQATEYTRRTLPVVAARFPRSSTLTALDSPVRSAMKQLRQAIVQLEATRCRTNPVEALRQWRVSASQNYVRRGSGLLLAAKKAPRK